MYLVRGYYRKLCQLKSNEQTVRKSSKERDNLNRNRPKPKLLIFVVAYNAEKTIENVLTRIPQTLADEFIVEVLIIDDASNDGTFELGKAIQKKEIFHLHFMYCSIL